MSGPRTMYLQTHPQAQLGAYWGHPIENPFHPEHEQYVAVALPVAPELQMKAHPNLVPVGGDVKPRLTKDQHEVLEDHFRREPKPSTQTKKDIAESLHTSLEKINNWFQNRRAKVKQDAKKQEMNQRNLMNAMSNAPMNGASSQSQTTTQHGPGDQTSTSGSHMATSSSQETGQTATAYDMQESKSTDLNGFTVPHHQAERQAMRFQAPRQMANVPGSSGELHGYYPSPPTEVGIPSSHNPQDDRHVSLSHERLNAHISQSVVTDSMESSATMDTLSDLTSFGAWPIDREPSISVHSTETYDDLSQNGANLGSLNSTPTVSSDAWPGHVQTNSMFVGNAFRPADESADGSQSMEATGGAPSTAGITDTLRNTTMQDSHSAEANFKQPMRTGLGDRRARRPANLTVARSSSYSYGMSGPGSPGNLSAAHPTDLSLRRIRSSGIGSAAGRIQKSASVAPPQRSPSNLTFADAAKFAYANATSSAAGTPVALGPLTPLTPADLNQPWMQGMCPPTELDPANSSPDSFNHTGMSFAVSSATSSVFPQGVAASSSPPTTPLDAEQVLKHQSLMNLRAQQMQQQYNPPQSAPATQQTFGPAGMTMPPSSQPMPFTNSNDLRTAADFVRNGNIRRPSLPDVSIMSTLSNATQAPDMPLDATAMGIDPQFWGPFPMFNESGALQTAYPTANGKLQFVGVPSSQYASHMSAQGQSFFPQQQQPQQPQHTARLNTLNSPSPGSAGHSPAALSQQMTPQPHSLQSTLSMQSSFSAASSSSSAMSGSHGPGPGMLPTGLEVHQYQARPKEESYGVPLHPGMSMAERSMPSAPPAKVFQFISERPANYSGK